MIVNFGKEELPYTKNKTGEVQITPYLAFTLCFFKVENLRQTVVFDYSFTVIPREQRVSLARLISSSVGNLSGRVFFIPRAEYLDPA